MRKLLFVVMALAISASMFFIPVNSAVSQEKQITMDFGTIGSKTDMSWSQAYFEASEHIKKKYPEVKVTFSDMNPYAEFPAIMEAKCQAGINILYAECAWLEAAQKVAPKYTKSWIQMPGALMAQLNTVSSNNVFSYTQKEEQGGYLAGVAAGLMTKSNTIGMVAGQDYPDIVRTGVGFREGVLSVNPKAKFLVMYTGDWVDVQKGYEAAKSMIESGADVLWHYTDNAGKGVAKAAQDHKAKKIYLFGQCRDQIDMAPDLVVTSCRVNHSLLAEEILKDYKAGKLKKGQHEFGIEEGWDVIAPIRNAPPSVAAKVKEALESIKKGKVKVTLTTDPKALTGTRSH